MNTRANSTLEYVVLITVIVSALIAMELYMKRSIQGRLRENLIQLTDNTFYSPRATVSEYTSITDIQQNSTSANSTTTTQSNMIQTTSKLEDVLPYADEPRRW